MLEAVVADAQRAADERQSAEAQPAKPEVADGAPVRSALPDLSNVLREAREKITSLGETAAAKADLDPPAESGTQDDASAVDDDLERRRQRLSKR